MVWNGSDINNNSGMQRSSHLEPKSLGLGFRVLSMIAWDLSMTDITYQSYQRTNSLGFRVLSMVNPKPNLILRMNIGCLIEMLRRYHWIVILSGLIVI